ncbi:MAG: hypothetical protein K2R98_32915 [Gemmataceae bacterium]|nr:hypothetical protein [Gemmataceae bacterium]
MCCFSRDAKVADTKIFARSSKEGRQFLVYSMKFSAKEDLAMILPIPVPKDSKEDAVTFINLEKYANFFEDMEEGFPRPRSDNGGKKDDSKDAPKLKVVDVGSFEASFVPAIKDFARLDERFRLPDGVWDKLPMYKDYGFAVFKLKKGSEHKVHPMAFEFPRANDKQLFFPTVHIHDGKVHDKAGFDHVLYCQPEGKLMMGWVASAKPAGMFMGVQKSQGLIDPRMHCYRKPLEGKLKNEDIIV